MTRHGSLRWSRRPILPIRHVDLLLGIHHRLLPNVGHATHLHTGCLLLLLLLLLLRHSRLSLGLRLRHDLGLIRHLPLHLLRRTTLHGLQLAHLELLLHYSIQLRVLLRCSVRKGLRKLLLLLDRHGFLLLLLGLQRSKMLLSEGDLGRIETLLNRRLGLDVRDRMGEVVL